MFIKEKIANDYIINNLTTSFYLKFTRSNIHGYTASIYNEFNLKHHGKKLAYAGGYGYDKTANALARFIVNHILDEKTTTEQQRMQVINDIDSGRCTSMGEFNHGGFIRYINSIGIEAGATRLNNGDYILTFTPGAQQQQFIQLNNQLTINTSNNTTSKGKI